MDKRNQILQAAVSLFAAKGDHLSIADIAKEVGLKKSSIYSHFTSRDEILQAAITTEVEAFFARLDTTISESSDKNCAEQLRYIFFWVIAYFQRDNRLRFWRSIPLLQSDTLRCSCRVLIQHHEQTIVQRIQTIFEQASFHEGMRVKEWPGAVYLYMVMVQGVLDAVFFYQNDPFNIDEFAQVTWRAYWRGVTGK